MATNNASNQRKPVNVSEGGTGASTLTSHGVLVGAGTGNIAATAAGTANQVLQSGGASADPVYSTATYPATTAQGDIIYSSAANTITGLTKDANATRYIANTGSSNNPAWAQVNLTNGVTGTLPVGSGGTGDTTLTAHGVLVGAGTSAVAATAAGTATQVLQSGGASADPVWSTATYPATTAQGDIIYSSAANTITGLTKNTSATRYIANTGSSNNPAWAQIDLTNGVTGVLPITNGGTNASSMANTYGVNYYDGTRLVTTAVGTAGHVLTSNGAGVAPTFQAASGGGITTLAGDSGTATGSTVTIAGTTNQITTSAASATVTLALASSPTVTGDWVTSAGYLSLPTTSSTAGGIKLNSAVVYHSYGTNNQFWGASAGNYTLTTGSAVKNVSLGDAALAGLTTAAHSVAVGYNTLHAHTAGDGCIAIGSGAAATVASAGGIIAIGNDALTAQTSVNTTDQRYGSIGLGWLAGGQLTTGRGNLLLGHKAGYAYNGSEEFNICIGTSTGNAGENHVIRIGTDGSGDHQQDACYIAGIYNHGSINNTGGFASILSTGQMISNVNSAYTYQKNIYFREDEGNTTATTLNLQKARSGGAITSGDGLGNIIFAGHDGTGYITASQITSTNSGTIATNRVASDLKFYTHPDSTTASTLRMTIASTGAVTVAAPDSGVGLTVGSALTVSAGNCIFAGSYGVTVGGTNAALLIDNTGLIGTTTSSERFKDNIEDMEDDSSKILLLRPVTFSYKKDPFSIKQYGLIAEEVAEIFPDLVNLDDEGLPHSVQYHNLPSILLNELIKLHERVNELEEKVTLLTKRVKSCPKE